MPSNGVTSLYILSQIEKNATWRESSSVPWGGEYRGAPGVGEFFQKLDAHMETISFEVRENIEHGDEVFSFGSYSGKTERPAGSVAPNGCSAGV
jgi:ketosteroid isomerase-like protein